MEKARTALDNTREYFKHYFKRYGIAAAVLSVICFVSLYSAIIPASAVIPSETFEFTQKQLGGIQVESSEIYTAQDPTIPRNAAGERLKYIGNFKVTHYCACTICTWGSGITASGKPVAEGMIASDWNVLPRGTKVYIKNGDTLIEKVVEDTGGAIQQKIIDVYVPSHSDALRRGVYYTDLYVDPDVELP